MPARPCVAAENSVSEEQLFLRRVNLVEALFQTTVVDEALQLPVDYLP